MIMCSYTFISKPYCKLGKNGTFYKVGIKCSQFIAGLASTKIWLLKR